MAEALEELGLLLLDEVCRLPQAAAKLENKPPPPKWEVADGVVGAGAFPHFEIVAGPSDADSFEVVVILDEDVDAVADSVLASEILCSLSLFLDFILARPLLEVALFWEESELTDEI